MEGSQVLSRCDGVAEQVRSHNHERRDVPEWLVDSIPDPFGGITFQTAGARLAAEIALRNCPFSSQSAWLLRLVEVDRVILDNIDQVLKPSGDERASRVEWSFENIGLLFAVTESAFPSVRMPSAELHASLALWLLVRSQLARDDEDAPRAERLEKQALWCLLYLHGEGGKRHERQRRSKSATVGAKALHEPHHRRKASVLEDYCRGAWKSKNQAATVLAPKHALAVSTVRKLLQGIGAERSA